jgi:uncharacterized damage-inducible protein DinB
MDPLKIYDYLIRTRERMFDSVRPLSAEQYGRLFPIGLKTIGATLTHLMISEWYYIERLEGRTVPPYDQWPVKYEEPHTPVFAVMEIIWREQWRRVRMVIATECERGDWKRKITWLSFPDDTRGNKRYQITATAGDFMSQLALHEMHHRSQAMMMLRAMEGEGVRPVQDIDYNDLMFERVEVQG